MADGSQDSSMRYTALPQIPRATFTPRKPTVDSACKGSCIKVSDLLRNRIKASCGRVRSEAMMNKIRLLIVLMCGLPALAGAQADVKPTNSLPNPYETVKDWAKLPEGRTWGSTSAVEIDKDGKSIWVA